MATSATPDHERRCSPWPFPSPRPSPRARGRWSALRATFIVSRASRTAFPRGPWGPGRMEVAARARLIGDRPRPPLAGLAVEGLLDEVPVLPVGVVPQGRVGRVGRDQPLGARSEAVDQALGGQVGDRPPENPGGWRLRVIVVLSSISESQGHWGRPRFLPPRQRRVFDKPSRPCSSASRSSSGSGPPARPHSGGRAPVGARSTEAGRDPTPDRPERARVPARRSQRAPRSSHRGSCARAAGRRGRALTHGKHRGAVACS